MIEELLAVEPTESFAEMCARMGAFLGLDGQVPENAMRRAIEDQDYANSLIACRNAPAFLEALFNDPGNEAYSVQQADGRKMSRLELARRAGNALVRWGKAGFSTVPEDVVEKRENTCLGCENLVKPESGLQKLVTSRAKEQIGKRAADCVCRLCGCSISKKILLPTESCPASRWGQFGG